MYEFGKIVLIPFPFTDLTSSKLRPALIVSKKVDSKGDVIVSFLTTKKPDTGFFFQISHDLKGFANSGLKTNSYLRLDKIATLNRGLILGELGFLSKLILVKIKPKFYAVFGF